MNAINKRKPYYYYLLTKYYFNDGQRKRAVNLLRSFIQKEESSFNKDAYFNCLYAWDENVPENMGWIEIILDIAAEVEFHNSRLLQWQYVIYASFIKDKAKGYIGNEDLSDSDLALILLCAYFTNDINYYNRFLYQLSEFERRFPKVAKISEKIFPLNEIMYKGDLDISTNEDEVRDVYNEFKNYSLN